MSRSKFKVKDKVIKYNTPLKIVKWDYANIVSNLENLKNNKKQLLRQLEKFEKE